ncbi:MAG: ATP-dependent Clp protease proteolytic subunit [Actinomycetota bacterium]|nr:ATP-dependent Clp protease proteolytic subunit [Actinomycetota bacterium]
MDIWSVVWIIFLISAVQPVLQQRLLVAQRVRRIKNLEKQRGSRVITLIHRREGLSFLGLPFGRFIDIDDSEDVLRAIELTDPSVPIDLVIHTPGGMVLAAEQIARALIRHTADVTVMVPHYAMSGGTLIALAADQILMAPSAVLGPVDPQIGHFPAASIINAVDTKKIDELDDETLIMADLARKAQRQVRETLRDLLTANSYSDDEAERLAEELSVGKWTHDFPITVELAQKMGLRVSTELPDDVRRMMELYPQPRGRRPSVEYIPIPYSPQKGGSEREKPPMRQ